MCFSSKTESVKVFRQKDVEVDVRNHLSDKSVLFQVFGED